MTTASAIRVARIGCRAKAAGSSLGQPSLQRRRAMRAFACQLRVMREHYGVSVTELAERCDLPRGVLQRVEEGCIDPPYSLILRLAEALEISATLLVSHSICEQDARRIEPRLRPPRSGANWYEARQAWEAIRAELRIRYAAGQHHRIMAGELGLTRTQLQTQLHHLFREGMPKR